MPNARSLATHPRLLALVAAALLLRALVPMGWMPVLGNGTVMLRLCSGMVAVSAEHPAAKLQQLMTTRDPVAFADHGSSKDDRSPADQPCSFAAAGLALATPGSLIQAEPLFTAPLAIFPAAVTVGRGLAAPPPRSTGPPLSS